MRGVLGDGIVHRKPWAQDAPQDNQQEQQASDRRGVIARQPTGLMS
jgi:hypothetical protein